MLFNNFYHQIAQHIKNALAYKHVYQQNLLARVCIEIVSCDW